MTLVGRQIGRYRILEQVGQGGMSVVYKGFDTKLDRHVAVKVLHTHLASKLESRKRLEREAKAVARLHHPNILEVFDFAGIDATDAFIVTEFIQGKTLRQFLSEESMQPPEIAAMVLHEIASALAHAHDAGVIHRDLKPENVMLREDGVLKLMDFGIAKILDRDEKMTMTGALVGSPAHMAPEIIEGEEAGPEADVFSLGTMLYLFATGTLPFTAPNTTATLKRILDCAYTDPRQVVPSVADELAEIIAQCLRRQPSERYPTAGKLRDALADYLSGVGLTRPHEELAQFFLDPPRYRKALTTRINTTLIARATKHLADKRSAKALADLNQVLVNDPNNEQANTLLSQMKANKARAARSKRLVRVSIGLGCAMIVMFATTAGFKAATREPDFRVPLTFGPNDIVLSAVQWPPRQPPAPSTATDANADAGVEAPGSDAKTEPKPAVPRPLDPRLMHRVESPKSVPLGSAAEPVEVQVRIRPWGYLSVDRGARTSDALAVHTLKLSPGPHELSVTCDVCETGGATVKTMVTAKSPPINMVAPLKSSLVSFQGYPADAVIRIGAIQKTATEAQTSPFKITVPPEGCREMYHVVKYEVVRDGRTIDRGERKVEPGKAALIEGRPSP